MEYVFKGLQPESLWRYFYEITQIPRPSKKEEKIRAYLHAFAKQFNLAIREDELGTIVITKPATPGMESRKTAVLQSHVDMVCEKNSDVSFDFDNDPIIPRIDGEWVKATGTTLGADNGIGVAASLAVLAATDVAHGPIECLFTIDEETGLTGAFGLKPDFISGRILLNLDSEDEGEIFIGCAGGKDTTVILPVEWDSVPEGYAALSIDVSGLMGGHSGDEIHKGLGNSNKILNRMLWGLGASCDLRLASFTGGNLHNAIPREATAVVCVPAADAAAVKAAAEPLAMDIRNEFRHTDAGLKISVSEAGKPAKVLSKGSQEKLIYALYACPHGVIAMSPVIPGLVETSTNLASVRTNEDHIKIVTSQRSSIESAKHDISNAVASTFRLAGAKTSHGDGYPGWTPNPDSPILEITKKAHIKVLGYEPKVRAIHAGLECGLIGEKYPGIDMISFGPTIRGPHSPDERLEIATVERFWGLLLEVLKQIP